MAAIDSRWASSVAISRREFEQHVVAATASLLAAPAAFAQPAAAPTAGATAGAIRGEPTAERVGHEVLAGGGNAIDAAVAAAFAAAVAAPHQTGIGGYGGHMVIGLAGGRVTCIDFNSAAPAAARADMYPLDAQGRVVGRVNLYGWLAAGVPGIPAGLELAAKRYGTRPLRDALQPAIALARDGFLLGTEAAPIRAAAAQLAADPASRALYLPSGQPPAATDRFRNPDLARLLETLAEANSTSPLYRGEIAAQIAQAFRSGGGLVTKEDLAQYEAREVPPLALQWDDWTVSTAPLTAGGLTVLQMLAILRAAGWHERPSAAVESRALEVEAFRYAWQDRLQFLGDPRGAASPLPDLLSHERTRAAASEIVRGVADRRPLAVRTTSRPDQGTIHLSAADRAGNFVAVTLTHGGAFGARVTVPGLGLTLGHGMSRFDPTGGPNAPGPGKRPLNNMCPTILAKSGRPVMALGGRGGRKIPNAVGEVLLQILGRGHDLQQAIAQPRLHTEGTLAVSLEKAWPADSRSDLESRGYKVTTGASATVSAVAAGDKSGEYVTAMR